jgi:3-oxoacyl-[acyl-carrier-protein] synthase III
MYSAGITALAVYYPEHVRTNAYWRERHPDVIAALEQKLAKQVWETGAQPSSLFAAEMLPYTGDVFRGSVERRVVAPGETALAMETRVARRALRAARLGPADIEYVLLTSFFPDQVFVGNAPWFARDLELTCPVWNTESACGSSTANLLLAASLVESGRAARVLVVISCTYSRAFDERNPMSWTSGDGAAAFVVSRVDPGHGVLGSRTVNTKETCQAFDWEVRSHELVKQTITFSATREGGKLIEQSAERTVPLCCHGAAEAAGVSFRDVRFFALPTPCAWFSSFARKKLGIAAEQTIDTYPRFTNTGPVLTPGNLYYGAKAGRFAPGDLVLMFALGSVSSAGAVVLRWADCALAEEVDE